MKKTTSKEAEALCEKHFVLVMAFQPDRFEQIAALIDDVRGPRTPLHKLKPIGFASVIDIDRHSPALTIGPHLPGVRDVAMYTKDQLDSAVNAAIHHAIAEIGKAQQ